MKQKQIKKLNPIVLLIALGACGKGAATSAHLADQGLITSANEMWQCFALAEDDSISAESSGYTFDADSSSTMMTINADAEIENEYAGTWSVADNGDMDITFNSSGSIHITGINYAQSTFRADFDVIANGVSTGTPMHAVCVITDRP